MLSALFALTYGSSPACRAWCVTDQSQNFFLHRVFMGLQKKSETKHLRNKTSPNFKYIKTSSDNVSGGGSCSVEAPYGLWAYFPSACLVLQPLGFPGGLCANRNWVWDSLACGIERPWFGVAVVPKIACLAKQAFCLPPTPKPRA